MQVRAEVKYRPEQLVITHKNHYEDSKFTLAIFDSTIIPKSMRDGFREFRRYPYEEVISQIATVFDASGIRYIIENTRPSFDITFTNSTAVEYILKVHEDDYERSIEIIDQVENDDSSVVEEHYMNGFSDAELLEVVENVLEWNQFDVQVAKIIIEKRGLDLSEHLSSTNRKEYQPEDVKPMVISTGYFMALLGGWFGLALAYGWLIKKSNQVGYENQHYYSENTRNHAKKIISIGIFILVIFVMYFIHLVRS
jgi:hypothetical protein